MDAAGTTCLDLLGQLQDRTTQVGWAEFRRRYWPLIFQYARRRGASVSEAEDIAQDIQLYLFKALRDFKYDPGKGGFRAYLRAAVVHAMGRRGNHPSRRESPTDPEILETFVGAPVRDDEREGRLRRLRDAITAMAAELEPATLEAFSLHVLADWSVEETALHLGVSRASVYQAKSRVLRRLRDRLDS